MPTRSPGLKAKWAPGSVGINVPLPGGWFTVGRVQVCVFPVVWMRGRGDWPQHWRDLPPVDGVTAPIYRWWTLGPIEVRLFRWAS